MKKNYLNDILKAVSQGRIPSEPGKVSHIEVLHDSDCPMLKGKSDCTCKPEVRMLNKRDFN